MSGDRETPEAETVEIKKVWKMMEQTQFVGCLPGKKNGKMMENFKLPNFCPNLQVFRYIYIYI